MLRYFSNIICSTWKNAWHKETGLATTVVIPIYLYNYMFTDLITVYYDLTMRSCVVRKPLGAKGHEDNSDTFPNFKELILSNMSIE